MSETTTCRNCGATLSPELDWCAQCFTPIRETVAAEADATASPESAAETEAPTGEEHIGAPTSIEELPQPTTSAWRSGPYSFGPVGRLLITALVILGGYVLYRTAQVVSDFYGHPGLGLVLILEAVYLVLAILVLWGVWRPQPVNK